MGLEKGASLGETLGRPLTSVWGRGPLLDVRGHCLSPGVPQRRQPVWNIPLRKCAGSTVAQRGPGAGAVGWLLLWAVPAGRPPVPTQRPEAEAEREELRVEEGCGCPLLCERPGWPTRQGSRVV